jgi:hypothetical protein
MRTRPWALAQDNAQLLSELWFRQAPANGTQPQRGVQHVLVSKFLCRHALQRLVGANVHRADGHRQALHRNHGVAVSLELLVLARQIVFAVHE